MWREIFAKLSNQTIYVLVIFTSNIKRSDAHNLLPIFRMLVIFAFSLKTRIARKFSASELEAFFSTCCLIRMYFFTVYMFCDYPSIFIMPNEDTSESDTSL